MKQVSVITCTTALLCLGAALPNTVSAEQKTLKDELVGTWVLQSDTNEQNGKKNDVFGTNPYGYFVFTPDGHFSISIARRDIPRFTSTRNNGTSEENKAVVQGSISYFGTYAVDPPNSLSLHIVASSFPNWDGVDQKRTVEVTEDRLKWAVPAASVGGTSVAMLERAKPEASAGH